MSDTATGPRSGDKRKRPVAGWRLVQPYADLPVEQARHHGYHDSDPAYRDQQSRATYDRLLKRFRGRDGLLRPRA